MCCAGLYSLIWDLLNANHAINANTAIYEVANASDVSNTFSNGSEARVIAVVEVLLILVKVTMDEGCST